MSKGIDDLLRFLVRQIALQSRFGASIEYVVDAISEFYQNGNKQRASPSAGHGDKEFLDQVWAWLLQSPSITLGPRLGQAVAFVTLDEVRSRNAKVAAKYPPARAGSPGSLAGEADKPPLLQLFASEEQIWRALTGHGIDHRKVSALEFTLLCTIACYREEGIIQPKLPELTGQDKRSIPSRTTRLAENGYLSKTPVCESGMNTTRLTLKAFVTEHKNEKGPADRDSWHWKTFGRFLAVIKEILKEIRDRQGEDIPYREIREKYDITNLGGKASKTVIHALDRFAALGCLEIARNHHLYENGDLVDRITTVRFKSDVTDSHWAQFWKQPKELRDQYRGGGLDSQDDSWEIVARGKNKAATSEQEAAVAVRPLWNPDRTLIDIAYAAIRDAGTAGLISSKAVAQIAGKHFGRPVSNLLSGLSTARWTHRPHNSQHLQILRDSAQVDRHTTFIFYSFASFVELVESGRKEWRYIGRSEPDPDAPGPYEFGDIPGKEFLTKAEDPTLTECLLDSIKPNGRLAYAELKARGPVKTKKYKPRKASPKVTENEQANTDEVVDDEEDPGRARKWKRFYTEEEYAAMRPAEEKECRNAVSTARRYHYKRVDSKVTALLEAGYALETALKEVGREIESKNPRWGGDAKWLQLSVLPEVGAKERRKLYWPSVHAHMPISAGPLLDILVPPPPKGRPPRQAMPPPPPKKQTKGSRLQLRNSKPVTSKIGYYASALAHSQPILGQMETGLFVKLQPPPKEKARTAKSAIQMLLKVKKWKPSMAAHSDFSYHFVSHAAPTAGVPVKKGRGKGKKAVKVISPEEPNGATLGTNHPELDTNASAPKLPVAQPTFSRSGREVKQTSRALATPASTAASAFTSLDSITATPAKKASMGAKTYAEQYKWVQTDPSPGLYMGPPCSLKRTSKGRGPRSLLAVFRFPQLRDAQFLTAPRPPDFTEKLIAQAQAELDAAASKAPSRPATKSPPLVPPIERQSLQISPAVQTAETAPTFKRKRATKKDSPQVASKIRKITSVEDSTVNDVAMSDAPLPDTAIESFADDQLQGASVENQAVGPSDPATNQDQIAQDGIHSLLNSSDHNNANKSAEALASSSSDAHVDNDDAAQARISEAADPVISAEERHNLDPLLINAGLQPPSEPEAPTDPVIAAASMVVPPATTSTAAETHEPRAAIPTASGNKSKGAKSSKKSNQDLPLAVSRYGGSLAAERKQIIIDVVIQNGGYFPAGWEMWICFTTRWQKNHGKNRPDTRTVKAVIKSLINDGTLKDYNFNFKDKSGNIKNKMIVMLPGITREHPGVQETKTNMLNCYPRPFYPPAVEYDPSLRKEERDNPHAGPRQTVLVPLDNEGNQIPPVRRKDEKRRMIEDEKIRKQAEQLQREQEEADEMLGEPTFAIIGYRHGSEEVPPTSRAAQNQFDLGMRPANRRERLGQMRDVEFEGDGPYFVPLPAYTADPEKQKRARRVRAIDTLYDRSVRAAHDSPRPDLPVEPKKSIKQAKVKAPRPAARMGRAPKKKVVDEPPKTLPSLKVQLEKKLMSNSEQTNQPSSSALVDCKQVYFPLTGTFGTFLAVPGWFIPRAADDILNHAWPGKPIDRKPELVTQSEKVFRVIEKIEQWEITDESSRITATDNFDIFINVTVESAVSKDQRKIRLPNYNAIKKKQALAARQTPKNTKSAIPQHADRVFELKRPGGKHEIEDPFLPPAKRRNFKAHRDRPNDPETDKRIMMAIVMAKILFRAGDPRHIDWDIVDRLLGKELEMTKIRKRYNLMRTPWKAWVAQTKRDLEERFLVAYAAGQLPAIRYDNLDATEWTELMEWVEGQSFGGVLKRAPNKQPSVRQPNQSYRLPASRQALNRAFTIKDYPLSSRADAFEIKIKGVRTSKRRDWQHEYPDILLTFRASSKPCISNETIARSWVRATATTENEHYDVSVARQKLMSVPELNVGAAATQMQEQRWLMKKPNASTGRALDISGNFVANFRVNTDPSHHDQATQYKIELDKSFKQEQRGFLNFDPGLGDGHMMAILNMFAMDMLTFTSRNIKSKPMGHLTSNYKTRTLDKNLLQFEVEIRPTKQYLPGGFQRPLPPRPLGLKHANNQGLDMTPIPVWFNIHGQPQPKLWNASLNVLFSICMIRPGVTVEEISKYTWPSLEIWELRLMMEWAVEARLADWVGKEKKGLKLRPTWWTWYGMEFTA